MGFSGPETAPTISLSLNSELLTWLVGKVSAFCLRMRGRERITHAKLSTREERVCLVEHVAKSFENSRSMWRTERGQRYSKLVNGRLDVRRILQHRLNESTP